MDKHGHKILRETINMRIAYKDSTTNLKSPPFSLHTIVNN